MNHYKTIGFAKSDKPFEKRIALLPKDLNNIKYKQHMYFESDYGKDYGIDDQEYVDMGAQVVPRPDILHCDIICDPKIGEATYLKDLKENTTLFGWIHTVEHKSLSDLLQNKHFSCYAWEDLYHDCCHVLWRNNQIAGEGAIIHALTCYAKMPYELNVAIIGRGNTAMGAFRILSALGASTKFYNRHMEKLLEEEIQNYDMIVNAVLWNVKRSDHLLSEDMMKKGSIIVDVSDDDNGAIENSRSTTIEKPTYYLNGIMIYAVNNVPSLFYKTAAQEISTNIHKYIDNLICSSKNTDLEASLIIDNGVILDDKIIEHQKLLKAYTI